MISTRSKSTRRIDASSAVAGADDPSIPVSSSQQRSDNAPTVFAQQWHKWQRRLPVLKRLKQMILRIPPRWRWAFIIFWVGWKVIFVICLFFVVSTRQSNTILTTPLSSIQSPYSSARILYIITTLSEFNTGTRATTKGQDRLGEILIPTLVDSVSSMVTPPFQYQVDVYLICAYKLSTDREEQIRSALPFGVGLQVWDDAAPIGYEAKHSPNKIIDNTRALARQHRYVIKDKFAYYDLFMAWEDDMLIAGDHVHQYLSLSEQLEQLYLEAPDHIEGDDKVDDPYNTKFYGSMSKGQLARVIPGFIRVEALLDDSENGAQNSVLPIDRDFLFNVDGKEHHIDPRICCHTNMKSHLATPKTPGHRDLIIWETNIKAFSLRKFPAPKTQAPKNTTNTLDWAVLMMGPGKRIDNENKVGGYWSGRNGAFGDEPRPSGGTPQLIAQQGGWMLTRRQIARMHLGLCLDSFLPPFDRPNYSADGQNTYNVEFWSGSYQIFTGAKSGCNMQRIISMQPGDFSKHLIYHTANNKQKQLTRSRMVRADYLFGQLNTVMKFAETEKANGAKK